MTFSKRKDFFTPKAHPRSFGFFSCASQLIFCLQNCQNAENDAPNLADIGGVI